MWAWLMRLLGRGGSTTAKKAGAKAGAKAAKEAVEKLTKELAESTHRTARERIKQIREEMQGEIGEVDRAKLAEELKNLLKLLG